MINPKTYLGFLIFFLIWLKKIKKEPIASRHMSVGPASSVGPISTFLQPILGHFGGAHTLLFGKNPQKILR